MACCLRRSNDEQYLTDKKISKQLREENRDRMKVKAVKLLLLGAGDSGKSTIAKQMKILYLDGYTEEERKNVIPAIHFHILSAFKDILKGVERYNLELNSESKQLADLVMNTPVSGPITTDLAKVLTKLCDDSEIKKVLAKCAELQLHDHFEYMMKQLDLIIQPSYVPTVEDILKVRVRTTGIMEMTYQIDSLHFTVMDMGGQRSERRKWIFFFEGVTAIIFVLAVNEYDMRLREDPKVNRMHESLALFKNIINNRLLQNTPIIFFLNKTDLFREKIVRSDMQKACFPDYNGGPDYDKALQYITKTFHSFDMNSARTIFTHETCATDTDNLRKVLSDVRVTLMQNVLIDIGIL